MAKISSRHTKGGVAQCCRSLFRPLSQFRQYQTNIWPWAVVFYVCIFILNLSTSRWFGQYWSTPVLCGTPVSPLHRRRHWSRCSAERCGSFSRTTTIRCRASRAGLETLESHRDQLTERFFQRSVLPESSCLLYLLPDKRDHRLQHPRNFETLKSRTAKFQNSLIPYSLTHFL